MYRLLLSQENLEPADGFSAETILWFGVAALGIIAAVQVARIIKGGMFSQSFAKLYGILFIALLGAVLVFVEVPAEEKAAAYTLFGTAAGYFAARPNSSSGDGA